MSCIFCQIVEGTAPCHKIWEDDEHLAFLSIFPNTEGFTVVIPKKHYPSYAFNLPPEALSALVLATQHVAKLLDSAFPDVGRTGMFFEGYGVDHVHSKLSPMHGTAAHGDWKPIESRQDKYFHQYEGYLSSHDCGREDDDKLAALAERIRHVAAKLKA
ncbi:TPA: HIT family protein [Klebsiella pneumoniae]|uniref:HIT family protein n=1 Tax=Klebsiella pneumoniae TaxID=573 RepID=UPI001A18B293|nr:HIT family protein [Salmonella enterica subsp. enterica serovar Saintpaul]HDU4307860.1 HIT family protein [Klebsiella aerogenes]